MAFNQINPKQIISWTRVITVLSLIEISFHSVAGTDSVSPSSQQLRLSSFPTEKYLTTSSKFKKDIADVYNSRVPFPFNFNVSKSQKTSSKSLEGTTVEKTPYADAILSNSIESALEDGAFAGMKTQEDMKSDLERIVNSKTELNNNLDLDVITQAFRFVKLDSYLKDLVTQLSKLQISHDLMQGQIVKQDTKFEILLDQTKSLVNFIGGESAQLNTVEEKIETEIQKMNHRLDQAVEKLIQSSTTSTYMFELSKESLHQMEKVEDASKQVLNEVKAVKTELGDVGQVSIQAIYNMHKLEENLMAGLEEIGNRTVYALRQDAKIIGPTVLLENGYKGNSIPLQADESNPGGFHSSVKKVSMVGSGSGVGGGGTIKAESLVSCLSRKRLINEKRPRDCGEIQLMGHLRSGVYTIFPSINSDHPTEVYCDLETKGGGWTLIQRRTDSALPRENFFRTWQEYQEGFGLPQKQYWLGLDKMAGITEMGDQEMRIELTDWSGEHRDANYAYFRVSNRSDKYRLHVADYSGTAGDSLAYHNTMPFSTKDIDNDADISTNCAERYQGAWWYKNCHQSNLNGVYMGLTTQGRHKSYAMGINWYSWHGYYYSIRQVEMKIRSRHFQTVTIPK